MSVGACQNGRVAKRFLLLPDVEEVLNISQAQAYALVRSGDLPAIQIGGRNQWRVEAIELEAYIQRQYAATKPATSTSTRSANNSFQSFSSSAESAALQRPSVT